MTVAPLATERAVGRDGAGKIWQPVAVSVALSKEAAADADRSSAIRQLGRLPPDRRAFEIAASRTVAAPARRPTSVGTVWSEYTETRLPVTLVVAAIAGAPCCVCAPT